MISKDSTELNAKAIFRMNRRTFLKMAGVATGAAAGAFAFVGTRSSAMVPPLTSCGIIEIQPYVSSPFIVSPFTDPLPQPTAMKPGWRRPDGTLDPTAADAWTVRRSKFLAGPGNPTGAGVVVPGPGLHQQDVYGHLMPGDPVVNGQWVNDQGVVAVDSAGNIYVADSGNNRILIFNTTGFLLQTAGTGLLKFPNGVALDSTGNIYVADTGNDRVIVFNPDGSLKQAIGTRGAGDGQFDLPMGVAVDSAGTKIYVADGNNNRVQVLNVPVLGAFALNKGWNLISIPAYADNSSVRSALANVSFNGIVGYDPAANGTFATPASLQPLYGYWINVTANDQVMVFAANIDPNLAPPGRNVYEGWNLIGVSASRTDPLGMTAGQLFVDLKYGVDPTQWYYTRLVSYDTSLPATYVAGVDLNDATVLNQGHGYWLFIKKIPNTNQNSVPWAGKAW